MIVIGLPGSGKRKSTIKRFSALGGHVIDADKVYHNLPKIADLEKRYSRFPDAGAGESTGKSFQMCSDENALSRNTITHKYVIQKSRR